MKNEFKKFLESQRITNPVQIAIMGSMLFGRFNFKTLEPVNSNVAYLPYTYDFQPLDESYEDDFDIANTIAAIGFLKTFLTQYFEFNTETIKEAENQWINDTLYYSPFPLDPNSPK
jgi:hypothetical protein